MVSYVPGVEYAGAHYRVLEQDKIYALHARKCDFEGHMWLSLEAKNDIHWWLQNLNKSRKIRKTEPDLDLFTVASFLGWGAHMTNQQTGGIWLERENDQINVLELRAILFGLKSLCRVKDKHIRIRTNSTTALAYVKNLGGMYERNQTNLGMGTGKQMLVVHYPYTRPSRCRFIC